MEKLMYRLLEPAAWILIIIGLLKLNLFFIAGGFLCFYLNIKYKND